MYRACQVPTPTPQLEPCTHHTHTMPTANPIRVRKSMLDQRCTVSAYEPEQKLIRRKYNKLTVLLLPLHSRRLDHFEKFSPPAVKFPSFYWLSLGENRVMHHFVGSTLEVKIQYIISLKHHFVSSFLKKKSPAAPIISSIHHLLGEKS